MGLPNLGVSSSAGEICVTIPSCSAVAVFKKSGDVSAIFEDTLRQFSQASMGCTFSCGNSVQNLTPPPPEPTASIRRHGTQSAWEPLAGYTRAVRAGPTIYVSGTVGVGEDGKAVKGAYEQAQRCFELVVKALEALGGSSRHVVRTRMYVRNIDDNFDDFAKAHREAFGMHPPASTMVEVSALVAEEYFIEVEAEAFVLER